MKNHNGAPSKLLPKSHDHRFRWNTEMRLQDMGHCHWLRTLTLPLREVASNAVQQQAVDCGFAVGDRSSMNMIISRSVRTFAHVWCENIKRP